jgi:RNA polymerase sigma factor (sigma-70 family)
MALARVAALALPGLRAQARGVTFPELVREHQDEVYGIALRMLGERDAALDVMANVFLKAYRSFHRYDQSRPARHWILRIAVNEAIDAARARTRDRSRRAPEAAAAGVVDPAPHPEDELVRREQREHVRTAVAALPELYRTVVVLRYFSGLSVEEIAHVLGRPASTVGVQLLRARTLLRSALGGVA